MTVVCNLCGRDSASILFVKRGFVLGRCGHCDLVYVRNPPAKIDLYSLYSFKAGYHQAFQNDGPLCEEQMALSRQHYAFIEKFKIKGRILDIGCSAGFFLKVARDLGWETYGLEISEDTAAIARERYGLKVTVGELQEATFESKYFDVVTLWDVVEHVQDPEQLVR